RAAHDVAPHDGDFRAVAAGDGLPTHQLRQAKPALLRLFDEVPVRGNPGWVLFLRQHLQAPAWRLEFPGRTTGSLLQDLAAARGHARLEDHAVVHAIPELVVGDAYDDRAAWLGVGPRLEQGEQGVIRRARVTPQ